VSQKSTIYTTPLPDLFSGSVNGPADTKKNEMSSVDGISPAPELNGGKIALPYQLMAVLARYL